MIDVKIGKQIRRKQIFWNGTVCKKEKEQIV